MVSLVQKSAEGRSGEFVYPALSPLPDELWLAPIQDGVADMAAAVRVR